MVMDPGGPPEDSPVWPPGSASRSVLCPIAGILWGIGSLRRSYYRFIRALASFSRGSDSAEAVRDGSARARCLMRSMNSSSQDSGAGGTSARLRAEPDGPHTDGSRAVRGGRRRAAGGAC
ncbi:hypothetical protein BE04_33730 [Sorangium cellulosum]|uniref:Uncharacterized protein n=1 Tax=Sorangium cellulosum TaxID=56 RepID=A0A150PEV2_SORCE|nr:hypothetical protein BE04_33730 [Sorangium cellulosum]